MSDELMAQFLVEGRELVASAEQDLAILIRGPDASALDSCFRAIHTLKGSTGLFDLAPMGTMLHAAEDLLTALRTDRAGAAEDYEALLDVVDHVDRWLDVLDSGGALPEGAREIGDAESRRLRSLVASGEAFPATPLIATNWQVPPAFSGVGAVAVRYTPRADSYFSGDDPVAIMAAVPGLSALQITPREPWGELDDYDPYTCNLVLEAAFNASRAEVEAALRFVADQIEIVELASGPVSRTQGEAARRTLRVDAERIDHLVNLTDDLVIAKNGLAALAVQIEQLPGGRALGQALRGRQAQLDRLVGDLHAAVGKVRLVPLSALFARFPRLTRELAGALHKDVTLDVIGGDVEVDKAIVDGLFDPLLHVLRNAIDHGVEAADIRSRGGKPKIATLRLTARATADQVLIELSDDGAGIDPQRIRQLAVERGLLTQHDADDLDDQAAIDLIFIPGFSTAASVSTVSGRGVGMDVVRDAVMRLGGRVMVQSDPGRGSNIVFMLPVTMVLTKVLIVTCGQERYGLALDNIVETVRVEAAQIVPVRAGQAFLLRGDVTPLVTLGDLLGVAAAEAAAPRRVVVARARGERVGLVVDAIVDRLDAAVRPMAGLLAGAPGVMGTTLLADGAVLIILDVAELVG